MWSRSGRSLLHPAMTRRRRSAQLAAEFKTPSFCAFPPLPGLMSITRELMVWRKVWRSAGTIDEVQFYLAADEACR